MNEQTNRNVSMSIFAVGAVLLLAVAAWALLAFAPAEAATTGSALGGATSSVASSTGQTAVTLAHWGRPGRGFFAANNDTYLADALGITAEALQAAKGEALAAALDDAVAEGLITQEQADAVLEGNGGFGRHGRRGLGAGLDFDTYLAEALGITVAELEAARAEAHNAAIDAALEAGEITDEQADLLRARAALKATIDHDALVAGVLGLTIAEYDAARAEGTSLATLLEDAGLTVSDFRAAVNDATGAAVQQAVEDGIITQDQADQILDGGFGLGFGGCASGRGGRGFGRDAFRNGLPLLDSSLEA